MDISIPPDEKVEVLLMVGDTTSDMRILGTYPVRQRCTQSWGEGDTTLPLRRSWEAELHQTRFEILA